MGFFSNLMGTSGEPRKAFIAPETRRGLFKLVLKDRWVHMIPLNLLYVVFHIPFIAWMIYIIAGIEQQLILGNHWFSAQMLGWFNAAAIGFIPCSMVIGIGSVGMAKVMRNWARDEHAFILEDFKDSIKKNWKQGLLLGLISGIIPLILYWYAGFFISNPDQYGMLLVPGVISAIVILLWLMSIGSMYIQAVTYDLKLTQIIKNGYIMNVAHFLTGLVLIIAEVIPIIIFGFVMSFILQLGMLLMVVWYLLFGLSLGWLIKASYGNRLCEEFINTKAGLPVRIGLREEQ